MQDQKYKKEPESNSELPPIPSKLYFTIGEVARLCDLKPHVLRYWEQEFPQLSPSKRRGNRRYYQRKDVILVRQIRNLLYNQGFTIEGARAQLSNDKQEKRGDVERYRQLLQAMMRDIETVITELDER